MTTLNVYLLSIDELLKYGKPQTALEEALFDKLKDAQHELSIFKEALDPIDRPDRAEDLEDYLDSLESSQCPSDYEDYKGFFEDIVNVFEDGCWSASLPSSDALKEAICNDLKSYAHYIATKDD